MNWTRIAIAALAGLLGAAVADLDAWSKSESGLPFAWAIAIPRWIYGATTGALAALGIEVS